MLGFFFPCLNDKDSETNGWKAKTLYRPHYIPSSMVISPNSNISSLPPLYVIKNLMQTRLLLLKSGIFKFITILIPDM